MSSDAGLRCFTAMAFGHEDTDELYERSIAQVVQQVLGTESRRVDRINHNDEITTKIVQEVRDCDLMIVDLTYARPSVYYEAGLASAWGKNPIFTVRTDYLRTGAVEPERVHFDLSVKNIIPWSTPEDPAFRRRLGERLRLLAGPLAVDRGKTAALALARQGFSDMSISTKKRTLQRVVVKLLYDKGFCHTVFPGRNFDEGLVNVDWSLGRAHYVFIVTLDTMPPKEAQSSMRSIRRLAEDIAKTHVRDATDQKVIVVVQLIALVLGRVQMGSIMTRLSDHQPVRDSRSLYDSRVFKEVPYSREGQFVHDPLLYEILTIVDDVKSVSEAVDVVKIGLDKAATFYAPT